MIGYLNDPEATEQALRRHDDGRIWLHTGDIGRMDADGYFYFIDRLKRMIKSSGFNVFPAQVEGVLRQHPLVARRLCRRCPRPRPDRARQGVCRAQGRRACVPGNGEQIDRVLPNEADQMVVPARHRIPHRPAENAHRQGRLQGVVSARARRWRGGSDSKAGR